MGPVGVVGAASALVLALGDSEVVGIALVAAVDGQTQVYVLFVVFLL